MYPRSPCIIKLQAKQKGKIVDLQEMIEHLYDLDREELRRLAWEALLISDGPDHIDGAPGFTFSIETWDKKPQFKITNNGGWEG
jgi:hypothetical protein